MDSMPGFIVTKVYSHLNKKEMYAEVELFLQNQPDNVVSLLRYESRKYINSSYDRDPMPRDFIRTRNPKINYSTPTRWRNGKDKMPIFFCCSCCNGRAFWSTPICGWCGKKVLQGIGADVSNTYLSFVEYLYPSTSKPAISRVLSQIIEQDEIDPHELELEMKNIKDYIPATAYVKEVGFKINGNEWSIFIDGSPVALNDLGIKTKNGFANLYYGKGISNKFFLTKELAIASNPKNDIGIKKLPLKELIIDDREKVLTLVPRNKNLNLGLFVI